MDDPGVDKNDTVKVAVRIRPLLQKERQNGRISMWVTKDKSIHQRDETQPLYTFDCVYDENTTTYDINEEISSPIVKAAMTGFHGTVFAYGQSGSGKTFTMSGDQMNPGIIKQAAQEMFNYVNECPTREFLLRMCYMEIYQEKISDLLSPEVQTLKIQENTDHQINVIGLKEEHVTSFEQVMEVIREGENRRKTAATKQNDRSSRSHSILRMIIESREKSEDDAVMVSHLNFVDLAGSEKAGDNTGDRLKEGCAINKSLLALSQVICKLSEGDSEVYIGYRDSKLTRILQNALGGNSKTAIICTIGPTSIEESHSTLKFASRAKKIKNKAHVNEVLNGDAALLKRYRMEIQRLQKSASEMGVIDMQMEKVELERKLKEKDELQNEQKRLIENLRRMVCDSNTSSDQEKKETKKKQRRETWCGPKLRRQSQFPIHQSFLSMKEMDYSTFEIPDCSKERFQETLEESNFSILSETALVPFRTDEPDQEKEIFKIQIKEMNLMLTELNSQYYSKQEELKELREFTALEKNLVDEELAEKVQDATKEIKNQLTQQNEYISQVEAEVYKVADEKTELNKQLHQKKEELSKLQQKVDKTNRESDKQNRVNQDYITMLERQVEQTEEKLKNIDKLRHSTGQILTKNNKFTNESEKNGFLEEIANFESKLQEKNYEIDTLKMENLELAKHQAKAREYRLKHQDLQDSIENKDVLSNFESSELITELKTKIDALESELELKNEALNNIDLESNNFSSPQTPERITSLEKHLEETKCMLTERNNAFKVLEDGIMKYNNQIQQLESEVEEKNKALNAINLENLVWPDDNSPVTDFKTQIQSLEKTIKEKCEENKNAKEECVKLKEEFSQNIQQLNAELAFKNDEIEKFSKIPSTESNSTAEIEELLVTISDLKTELCDLHKINETKSQRIVDLETEKLSNVSYTEDLDFVSAVKEIPTKSSGLSLQDEMMQCDDDNDIKPIEKEPSIQEELLQNRIQVLEEQLEEALGKVNQNQIRQDEHSDNNQNDVIVSHEIHRRMEAELNDLNEKLNSKSEQIEQLQIQMTEQITEKDTEIEDLKLKLETLMKENIVNEEFDLSDPKIHVSSKHASIDYETDSNKLTELTNEITDLQNLLEAKEFEITKLNTELEDAKQELETIAILNKKIQEFIEDVQKKDELLKSLQQENRANLIELETENTSLRDKMVKINEELQLKSETLTEAVEKLSELENETDSNKLTELTNEITDLQNLLESKEFEITTLNTELDDTKQVLETIAILNNKIQEFTEDVQKKDELIMSLQNFQTRAIDLETENGLLQDKLVAINEELQLKSETLTEAVEKLSELETDVHSTELNSEVATLQRLLESKETEMTTKLNAELEKVNQQLEAITILNQKIQEFTEDVQKKDEIIATLQENQGRVFDLESENSSLHEKMATNNEELQLKSETLMEAVDRVSELEKEVETLQNDVGDMEAIVDKETNENTENKEIITQLQEDVSNRRNLAEEMEQQIKELNASHQNITHDYKKLQQDHTDLQSWYQKQQEAEALRADGKDAESLLKQQLSELRIEFNVKKEEIDRLETEFNVKLANKDGEVEILEDKFRDLNSEIESVKMNSENAKSLLENQLSELGNELSLKREEMNELKRNHNEMIVSKDDELGNLQQEIESMKVEFKDLVDIAKEKSELDKDVEENIQQIANLQVDLEEKSETISNMEREKQELEEQLNGHITMLKEVSNEKEIAISSLLEEHELTENDLQEQLTNLRSVLTEREGTISTLQNEKASLEEEISELQRDLTVKTSNDNSLKAKELIITNLQDEIECLQEQISKLQKDLTTKVCSDTALEEKEATIESLHEQIVNLQNHLSTKSSDDALDKQITNFRTVVEEKEKLVTSLKQELIDTNNTFSVKITKLQSDLEENIKTITILRKSEEKLEEACTHLQKDKKTAEDNLQQEISVLKEELIKDSTTINQLKQDNLNCTLIDSPETNLEERFNELLQQKANLETLVEAANKDNDKKLQENEAKWKKIELEMKKERFLLRGEVRELKKSHEKAQRGFDFYGNRCEELIEEIKTFEQEKENWDENLKIRAGKWEGLETQCVNLNLEVHALKYKMEKQIQEHETKVAALTDTIDYKESVVTRLKDQIRRTTTDLDETTCDPPAVVKERVEQVNMPIITKNGIIDSYTVCLLEAENKKLNEDQILLKQTLKDITNENETLKTKVKKLKQEQKDTLTKGPNPLSDIENQPLQSELIKKRKISEALSELNDTVSSPQVPFDFSLDFLKSPKQPMFPFPQYKDEKVKEHALPGLSPSKDPSQCKNQ